MPGLPYVRNVDHVPGATPVGANLLNDLQDYLIDAWGRGWETVAGMNANANAGEASGELVVPGSSQVFGWGRGGHAYATATARTLASRKGVIGQIVGGELLLYELAADEILQQLSAGDATNPRIDTIEVKLSKGGLGGYTTLAWNRLAGTPAGSPTKPALTSGYARWLDVLVPATYNAVFIPETHFRDWRLPLSQRQTDMVWPDGLRAKTFGNGLINTGDGQQFRLEASAAAQFCQYVPRGLPGRDTARMLRFRLACKLTAGGWVKLSRQSYAGGSPTALKDYTSTFVLGSIANVEIDLVDQAGDGPFWARGFQGGPAAFSGGDTESLVIDIKSGAANDYVSSCEVQWAG